MFGHTITPAINDPKVEALDDRFLPGWHSALLCKYTPGVGINLHWDHICFAATAFMVNLGEAILRLSPNFYRFGFGCAALAMNNVHLFTIGGTNRQDYSKSDTNFKGTI